MICLAVGGVTGVQTPSGVIIGEGADAIGLELILEIDRGEGEALRRGGAGRLLGVVSRLNFGLPTTSSFSATGGGTAIAF